MRITNLETTFTLGADPASPVATDIALEADCTEAEAQAMISTAWAQVEAFTNRSYRPITAGKVVLTTSGFDTYPWPRHPFPAAITVEILLGGSWVANPALYVAELGLVDLETHTTYRLTQSGTVAGRTPSAAVVQAVTNLALYQLIHAPARREFKSQSAGDTSFTREAIMGVLYGSGAGAMLASEVRG